METLLKQYFPFWDKITKNEQKAFIDNVQIKRYSKGQNIYSADNECLGVTLVLKGELRTYMLSDDGKEITLYRLKSGEICILSASCLLKNITFDVFIDADSDCEVLLVNSSFFESLQQNNIYVENFALKVAVGRFSDVMWSMEQMLFYKIDKRLALFLIDESNKTKSDVLKITHEQIAKYIGSAREVVSRMLKTFERQEIVSLSSGQIQIINKEKLNGLNI